MRLYLAGAENNAYYDIAKNDVRSSFLTSYYYIYKRKPKCLDVKNNLFLDSGAFSALHSGASIDIQAYCDFIKEHGVKFEKVAQLDCIGDYKGTEKNLDYMRGQGLDPIPVFHTNEPFDWLDELLKNDNLCVGATGSKLRQPQIIAWLVEVFKHREKINPACKMHGFAMTNAKIMKYFDWDSCDSTTWLVAYKFRRAMAENCRRQYGKKNQLHKIFKKEITKDELALHNVTMIYNYVDKLNTLKGKAVVSPKPTV
jgi:hypothetical protein